MDLVYPSRYPNLVAVVTVLAAVGVVAASPAVQSNARVDGLLRQMGFSAGDVRKVDAGEAVSRTLDTPVREELAHVGAVSVDVPVDRFLDQYRDIERFERGPGIPHIGRFSNPPRLSDLSGLSLPDEDVRSLQRCRLGDCDLKLSAETIARIEREVDWSSPDAARRANDIIRSVLLKLVVDYQSAGNAALGYYNDDDEPLPVAASFSALLDEDNPLPVRVPALLAYLDTYPRNRPAGVEEFFYWTLVEFGLKPTIRVNHVAIYPLPERASSGVAYAIATKQLYASHYFHTTLELRFLVDDLRHADRLGLTVITITRSRNDGMTGFTGFFMRPIISGRSRDGVRRYLEHVKNQVEEHEADRAPGP